MIEMFEKPIEKRAAEMQSGDVMLVEYGDYDNWCKFVFESCNASNERTTETHFHKIGSTESKTMYEFTNIEKVTYTVIGKEIEGD